MRRNDLEICVDILSVALKRAKKTHIVYKANLNFKVTKKYLKRLMNNGLIQFVEGKYYITTQKGIHFLNNYWNIIAPIYREQKN